MLLIINLKTLNPCPNNLFLNQFCQTSISINTFYELNPNASKKCTRSCKRTTK